jgi:hypothetical protein
MTKITSLSISTLLGLCLLVAPAQPAQAAVGDPELILYRFSGVKDDGGGSFTGVATSFHCTNFSGVMETIRIVVRHNNSNLVANIALDIPHLRTFTMSTHVTSLYVSGELGVLNTGFVHGTAAIAATSTSITCTAMTVDAASTKPAGIALRGIRFNPAPGSQE